MTKNRNIFRIWAFGQYTGKDERRKREDEKLTMPRTLSEVKQKKNEVDKETYQECVEDTVSGEGKKRTQKEKGRKRKQGNEERGNT